MTSVRYCYGPVAAAATVSAAGTPRLSGTPNVNRFLVAQFLQWNDACGTFHTFGFLLRDIATALRTTFRKKLFA